MGSVASMMQGHALQLKRQHSATSTDEDKNKENSTPVQLVSGRRLLPSTYGIGYDVGLMELPKEVQEWLLEETHCTSENNRLAMEVHECTMSSLLAVIHEGLFDLDQNLEHEYHWKHPTSMSTHTNILWLDMDVGDVSSELLRSISAP